MDLGYIKWATLSGFGQRSRYGRGGVAGLDVGCTTLSVVDFPSQTSSDELGSGIMGPGAHCGEPGRGGAEEEGPSLEELGPRIPGMADVLDSVATLSEFGLDSTSVSYTHLTLPTKRIV